MDLIKEAIETTVATSGEAYFERPAGSTLTQEVDIVDLLRQLDWVDVTDDVDPNTRFGGCTYLRATLPEGIKGLLGVRQLSELTDDELRGVRVQRGHHGNLEFVMEGMQRPVTDSVTLILGSRTDFPRSVPQKGDCQVVTWHPGAPVAPVDIGGAVVKAI